MGRRWRRAAGKVQGTAPWAQGTASMEFAFGQLKPGLEQGHKGR